MKNVIRPIYVVGMRREVVWNGVAGGARVAQDAENRVVRVVGVVGLNERELAEQCHVAEFLLAKSKNASTLLCGKSAVRPFIPDQLSESAAPCCAQSSAGITRGGTRNT